MAPPPSPPPLGILLLQLGTPAAPTAPALRRYLAQFLADPRVIEVPRWLWWPVLHLLILPFRPRASAARYRRIWSEEHGSPLLHATLRQAELVGQALGPGHAVAAAMRYGEPSIQAGLESLLGRGAERVVALPLYPQYSASSTATALDELYRAANSRRRVPALHVVPPFFDREPYLEAVARRCRETLARLPSPPDHILVSFHGLPREMVARGDPYAEQCLATARALAARIPLPEGGWSLAYQSRFGRARWLEPPTEPRLQQLAREGKRRVLVLLPGFVSDCLETLDEIGNEAAHAFRRAGGERLDLVPCLNDHPAWIAALRDILREEAGAWSPGRP